MTDVIIELRKERAALHDRLEKIDAAIADYERWARSAAELVGGGDAASVVDAQPKASEEQTPIATFEQEVRALFDRTAAPLKRMEVNDALASAGVIVGGKDPLNTIAARLSRMHGITNLKGHGYWAEDRPYPPAGHSGASDSGTHEDAAGDAGTLFKNGETATNEA